MKNPKTYATCPACLSQISYRISKRDFACEDCFKVWTGINIAERIEILSEERPVYREFTDRDDVIQYSMDNKTFAVHLQPSSKFQLYYDRHKFYYAGYPVKIHERNWDNKRGVETFLIGLN